MTYTIPKPRTPLIIYLFFLLITMGVIYLFIAAQFAFGQVTPFYQSVFAAILIEAGIVIEALAVMREKTGWAVIGLLISFVVSLTYNYIQVQTRGGESGLTNAWQLFVLSVGPLTALTVAALQTGLSLRKHEEAVKEWEKDRQDWYDKEMAKKRRVARRKQVGGKSDWRKLTSDERKEIFTLSVDEIMEKYPVSRTTAYEWRTKSNEIA